MLRNRESRKNRYRSWGVAVNGILVLILLAGLQKANAQGRPATAFQVEAAFLYNFSRFVEWPESAYSSGDSPFVIGVIGNKPLTGYLRDIVRGEKVGTRPIVVQTFQNIRELPDCQILFLSAAEAARGKDGLRSLQRSSILTVSDADKFLEWGGMVRFYTIDNKIRIQINASAARLAELQVSSKLLNVASQF